MDTAHCGRPSCSTPVIVFRYVVIHCLDAFSCVVCVVISMFVSVCFSLCKLLALMYVRMYVCDMLCHM